jgi:flagellar biosynthesis protein FliP
MKGDGGNAVQILLLVGGLTLIPALLFTVTGFTRILIVLGFIRTAIGTPTVPPNQVLVGIALFLTLFVMAPTFNAIKNTAWDPLQAHRISAQQAMGRAQEPLREFMFRQTPRSARTRSVRTCATSCASSRPPAARTRSRSRSARRRSRSDRPYGR